MDEWKMLRLASNGTHHVREGKPAYSNRFDEVLKYHAPGLAAVKDGSGAYHINTAGQGIYAERYIRTFGFYEDRAAIQSSHGWHHLLPNGRLLAAMAYDWCGNFQEGHCAVRLFDQHYVHIQLNGDTAYPAHYCYVGDYHDGMAVVQREDGLHTHITYEGSIVHSRWFLDLDVFHKGYARACDEHGWHHITSNGQPLYPRRFAMIEPFYNGQARVEDWDHSLLVIDEHGEIRVRLRPCPL